VEPSEPWIREETAVAAKLAIALATAALLLANAALARAGRDALLRRTRDAALGALGLLGGLGWWHFLAVPLWNDVHEHDAFHYYLGARYFPELGYTHLYLCTLGADLERGSDPGARLRDLETNELVHAVLRFDAARACRERFTPERWYAFQADLDWFRARLSKEAWHQIRKDHGFNGSPVWLVAGGLLADTPGGARALPWLVLVDPLLLGAMWLGVVAAFGWRPAAVAAVFWGTNGVAGFDWTGGSLLRQDWLVTLVLALACLRRGRPGLAGVFLATSTLLRIFPALVGAGLVARYAVDALRARSSAPLRELGRFAAGAALAALLLVPLAIWRAGPGAWSGFAANSAKLLETPLVNHVGLLPLVTFDADASAHRLEDPGSAETNAAWKNVRRERRAERAGWVVAIALAWAALFAAALPGLPAWAAAALATGAIPVATPLTPYYHAALLGLALLVAVRPGAGVAMALLAAATQLVAYALPYSDVPFALMSAAEVATVFAVTGLVVVAGRRQRSASGPRREPRRAREGDRHAS
jgi:hypothetical protein